MEKIQKFGKTLRTWLWLWPLVLFIIKKEKTLSNSPYAPKGQKARMVLRSLLHWHRWCIMSLWPHALNQNLWKQKGHANLSVPTEAFVWGLTDTGIIQKTDWDEHESASTLQFSALLKTSAQGKQRVDQGYGCCSGMNQISLKTLLLVICKSTDKVLSDQSNGCTMKALEKEWPMNLALYLTPSKRHSMIGVTLPSNDKFYKHQSQSNSIIYTCK